MQPFTQLGLVLCGSPYGFFDVAPLNLQSKVLGENRYKPRPLHQGGIGRKWMHIGIVAVRLLLDTWLRQSVCKPFSPHLPCRCCPTSCGIRALWRWTGVCCDVVQGAVELGMNADWLQTYMRREGIFSHFSWIAWVCLWNLWNYFLEVGAMYVIPSTKSSGDPPSHVKRCRIWATITLTLRLSM